MRANFQIIAALLFSIVGSLSAAEPVKVAALSPIFGDLAARVGGDRVEVIDIVPPGQDPHDFELTAGDLKKMSGANLIVAGGLGFEPYLDKLRDALPDTDVVALGDFVKPIMIEAGSDDAHHHDHDHDHDHEHDHDAKGGKYPDPHWWQSVPNMQRAAKGLQKALTAEDPDGKANYAANTRAYVDELADLHRELKVKVAAIPRERRVLVTSHAALNYLAKEYDFEVESIAGISTADSPSSREIRDLIDKMKEKGVTAIFAENAENPKVLEQIANETGATLGGTLFVDTTEPGKADTYIDLMRHNISTVTSALK